MVIAGVLKQDKSTQAFNKNADLVRQYKTVQDFQCQRFLKQQTSVTLRNK